MPPAVYTINKSSTLDIEESSGLTITVSNCTTITDEVELVLGTEPGVTLHKTVKLGGCYLMKTRYFGLQEVRVLSLSFNHVDIKVKRVEPEFPYTKIRPDNLTNDAPLTPQDYIQYSALIDNIVTTVVQSPKASQEEIQQVTSIANYLKLFAGKEGITRHDVIMQTTSFLLSIPVGAFFSSDAGFQIFNGFGHAIPWLVDTTLNASHLLTDKKPQS